MRIIILMFLLGFTKVTYACHGMALVSPSVTMNSTSLQIDASSDPAAWMCGPYTMQVELSYTGTFTGTPPQGFANPAWQTFPFYHSLLNIPNYGPPQWNDGAVLEPYETIWIDFIYLCPGTTVYVRMREYVEASMSAGPWSTPLSVTIPGSPLVLSGNVFASDTILCPGDSAMLHVTHNGCSGNYSVSWLPAAGLSDPFNDSTLAAPFVATTYTVTVTDLTVNQTFSSFVTVNPDSCLQIGIDEMKNLSDADIWYNSPSQRIELSCKIPLRAVRVYSIDGKLCYSEEHLQSTQIAINAAGWKSGIYLVEALTEDKRTTVRVAVY